MLLAGSVSAAARRGLYARHRVNTLVQAGTVAAASMRPRLALAKPVPFNFAAPVRGFAGASDDKALKVVGNVEGDGTSSATGPKAKRWPNFSKTTISLLSIAATLTGVVAAAWLTGITGPDRAPAADKERKQQQAAIAEFFRDRRVKAVKERLKSSRAQPQPRSDKGADRAGDETLRLFDRPYAVSVVAPIVETPGLYMLCGPKGDGKSSLVSLLAVGNPFVILVDLQNGSIDKAVRAVAAAIGYSLDYTADELAAKAAGVNLPAINAQQSVADFEELLLVFEQACNELRAEGALRKERDPLDKSPASDHVPVLILDHANRPKPGPTEDPKASIINSLVEIGHRIANKRTASWAAVTSDPQQEHDAWTKAGGRDSLTPIRAPPFSEDEARELLARYIFNRRSSNVQPTTKQLDAIKLAYRSTLDFACGGAGMRARWLLHLLQFSRVPLSDEELATQGVAVDPAFYPNLPPQLRSPDLRVDKRVWAQFSNLLTERKEALKPLLEVDFDFALPPVRGATPSPEDLTAKRVLATDAALRDLLKAAAGDGAAEERPTASMGTAAAGVPAGMTFEALRDKYFAGQDSALRELCAKHVLFYNHGARTLEFESELMRRFTASWLEEPRHKDRVALLRKLQAWQQAKQEQAGAKQHQTEAETHFDLRVKAAAVASTSKKDMTAAGEALSAARAKSEAVTAAVEALEGEIKALRDKLRLYPHA